MFELGGEFGVESRGRSRSSVQYGLEDDARSVSAERQRTGGHLVEHHSERKKIGAGIEFLAANLLGRHISDRSKGGARTGEVFQRLGGRSDGGRTGGINRTS